MLKIYIFLCVSVLQILFCSAWEKIQVKTCHLFKAQHKVRTTNAYHRHTFHQHSITVSEGTTFSTSLQPLDFPQPTSCLWVSPLSLMNGDHYFTHSINHTHSSCNVTSELIFVPQTNNPMYSSCKGKNINPNRHLAQMLNFAAEISSPILRHSWIYGSMRDFYITFVQTSV